MTICRQVAPDLFTTAVSYTHLIARKRLYEMNVVISDTAEYGNYLFSYACVPLLKPFMAELQPCLLYTSSCSGMFTANSMNCLTEALGLSQPGNGCLLYTSRCV